MIFARMILNQEARIHVKNQDESRTNDHEGGLQFVAHILQNKRRSFCHNQDLSNQAVIFVSPNEIKSIESFRAFHDDLETLPVPQTIKDALKPNIHSEAKSKAENDASIVEESAESQDKKGFFTKGKSFAKKVGESIGDTFADVSEKAMIFSEENFRSRKVMERQMLFFGVVCMYNEGLETFMKL